MQSGIEEAISDQLLAELVACPGRAVVRVDGWNPLRRDPVTEPPMRIDVLQRGPGLVELSLDLYDSADRMSSEYVAEDTRDASVQPHASEHSAHRNAYRRLSDVVEP